MLERNGVLSRMGSNPFDENATDLLVPATEVLWAAELIRRMNDPKVEKTFGFPMAMPPPLPVVSLDEAGTEPAGAMRVLELDQPLSKPEVFPNYGCAMAVLWVLLILTVLFLVVCFVTYTPY
jgi:hypothetical protein